TLHAGGNMTLGENVRPRDIKDVLGFSGGLSVGKYFSPAVGARAQVIFNTQKGVVNAEALSVHPELSKTYGWKNIQGYVDALFNLTNIFSQYKESRRFNVNGIIGLGFNNTFGYNDEAKDWTKVPSAKAGYGIDTENRSYFAARAGFLCNYKLSEALDLGLEATINATDDKYNGIYYDDNYDGYVNLLLGLTYHFKDHYGDRRFKYAQATDADYLANLNAQINKARKDLADAQPKTIVQKEVNQQTILDMTVNFIIDKYNITDIQKRNVEAVAKYIKDNPDINIVVTGYADVQTAYPAYNLKLSENRAKAVYNMLVNEFGVDPSRLKIDFKGDTVQPYELKNEWNRVVIFVVEPRN
ncbi:MAG: OmpA family protein, partial [Prevotella sp.]|nr:OmpA family protein [Prevotella sp.]